MILDSRGPLGCVCVWVCGGVAQGPDRGTQYRTGIYYFNEEQRQQAEDAKEEAQKKHASPIVTEIKPASNFWMAEEYHQQYFEKRGGGSCH